MKTTLYVIAAGAGIAAVSLFGLFIFSAYWAIFQPGADGNWVESAFFSVFLSIVFGFAAYLAELSAEESA